MSGKPTYRELAVTPKNCIASLSAVRGAFSLYRAFGSYILVSEYDGLLHWRNRLRGRWSLHVAIEPRAKKVSKGSCQDWCRFYRPGVPTTVAGISSDGRDVWTV
jgi:hypothetical protein